MSHLDVVIYDHRVVFDFLTILFVFVWLIDCGQDETLAIGREMKTADAVFVRSNRPGFAAIRIHHPHLSLAVLLAIGEKREHGSIRRPFGRARALVAAGKLPGLLIIY